MSRLTDDPNDPGLSHGVDSEQVDQAEAYLVLPEEERRSGFQRRLRRVYLHQVCGTTTTMSQELAETYARDPKFYGATYCVECRMHLPVGEFTWVDRGEDTGERVGS